MTQGRVGRCAFCGGTGLSNEHIIAGWIKRLLPDETQHFRFRGSKPGKSSSTTTQLRLSQGTAFTAKTRKVCVRCNKGWMSALEAQVRPLLTPLIRGDKISLPPEAQAVVAGWVAKTVMAADTLYPESSAISQAERSIVAATNRPPEGWMIWLALHNNSDWRTGLDHVGVALHRKAEYERKRSVINTQSTTIGIGNLLIHAFSSALPDFQFNPSGEFGGRLHRIWPCSGEALIWPPINALLVADVERLGRHLFTFSKQLRTD
jgi:hypothetical protein